MRERQRRKIVEKQCPTELTKSPETVKLKNVKYDETIFKTMKTETIVDEFFSNKSGIPKACNFILIGDPGVGKTTLSIDILADIVTNKKVKKKGLFISGEMNRIDMYEYIERFPKFAELEILFLGEYSEENPKLVIEDVLSRGYDLVVGDSFAEITEEIKESCGMSSNAAEKWLIDLMLKHNEAHNDRSVYTTFIMIQQMTKGGKFVGSNKLKHNTTGMLELRFEGSDDNSPRYMSFSKNRRGNANKKLYFDFTTHGHVNYYSDKWISEETNRERLKNEMEDIAKESEQFDELLRSANEEQPVLEELQEA